jgi:2-iminobutanoate/2-iminopropanoate deaminase
MATKAIDLAGIYRSHPGSVHAVRFGDTVYTSAILPKDAKGHIGGQDLSAQAELAFRNLDAVLAGAGAGMDDVAKINLYLEPAAFGKAKDVQAIAAKRLRLGTVAGTIVPISLPESGVLLSVEAIAHVGAKRKAVSSAAKTPSDFGWAEAVVAGNTMYVSGRYGKGEPFLAQAKSVYDAFDAIVKAAGVAWRDVVRIHQFAIRPDLSIDDLRVARSPYLRNTEFLSTSVVCHPPQPGNWQIVVDIEATVADKTYSSTPGTWANPGGLHAVKSGGTGYFTAQMSRDGKSKTLFPDDVEAHANQVCVNIDAMLTGAGLSWKDAAHARVFCSELKDLPAVRKVVDRWIKSGTCARTELVVGFFDPLATVEIEITAALS